MPLNVVGVHSGARGASGGDLADRTLPRALQVQECQVAPTWLPFPPWGGHMLPTYREQPGAWDLRLEGWGEACHRSGGATSCQNHSSHTEWRPPDQLLGEHRDWWAASSWVSFHQGHFSAALGVKMLVLGLHRPVSLISWTGSAWGFWRQLPHGNLHTEVAASSATSPSRPCLPEVPDLLQGWY